MDIFGDIQCTRKDTIDMEIYIYKIIKKTNKKQMH